MEREIKGYGEKNLIVLIGTKRRWPSNTNGIVVITVAGLKTTTIKAYRYF